VAVRHLELARAAEESEPVADGIMLESADDVIRDRQPLAIAPVALRCL